MSTPGEQPIKLSEDAERRVKELQALISDLQARADKAQDEDVREGFTLQVSKLGLKVARIRKGEPEDLPSEVEAAAVEAQEEPIPTPTPSQLEEAEMLIRRSLLEKNRGNKQAASDLVKQAAEVAPGAATVLEALGDDLIERHNYAAAHEAYRAAHRADPKNAAIERKYAQLSMHASGNMSIDDQLRLALADSALIAPEEAMASPRVAIFLSAFVPGSGQFVLGYGRKGGLIFAIWVLSVAAFFFINFLWKSPTGNMSPWSYFPLAIAVMTWLAGVADCSSMAKAAEKKDVSKPVPPVNLPFE